MKIAFTGRRPKDLVGYTESKYTKFISDLTELLKSYGTDTEFICGGAQGFDQLAFIASEKVKETYPNCKTHLYLPFQGQESRWLAHGFFGQDMYRNHIAQADTSHFVTDLTSHDYSAIVKALYARNEAMVNDADIVIALYPDDEWKTSNGGTAGCMRYAIKQKKPVYQLKYRINATSGELEIVGTPTLIEETAR